MPIESIVKQRFNLYNCKTSEDEENAIKEITQEIILYALHKANFFKHASFQGGTALRILYGLNRFSEDMDFALINPDPSFKIAPFIEEVGLFMKAYGYDPEVSGKDKADSNIKQRFIKDDSIKNIIEFSHKFQKRKKIKIKVEVDINPPAGANSENTLVSFPIDYYVSSHSRESLFAGKCHALLCRQYTKGRDIYDFSWYISNKVKINYELLKNALYQLGPWKEKKLKVDKEWFIKHISEKFNSINFSHVKEDVLQFLKAEDKEAVKLWSKDFFNKKIEQLSQYL